VQEILEEAVVREDQVDDIALGGAGELDGGHACEIRTIRDARNSGAGVRWGSGGAGGRAVTLNA
jgi:hypothetical protein